MKKIDLIFTILLTSSIILLYFTLTDPQISQTLLAIQNFFYNFTLQNQETVYLSIALISFLSCFSIFMPIPYTLIIILLATQPINHPLLIITSGTAAGLGEVSAYALGYGISKLKQDPETLENIKKLIKKYGYLAVFIFALTPLPDDLLLIPLGMLKYSLTKTLIASILGKIAMTTILVYGGNFGLTAMNTITQNEAATTIITIIATIILLYIMLKNK